MSIFTSAAAIRAKVVCSKGARLICGGRRLACIWKCNHRSTRRCSYRRRWRVFDSAAINAAQDFELPIRRELSRARVQGIDDSARSERFMANGKERPPHLATEK